LAVPSKDTSIINARVPNALAQRVKALAARSGRTPNKFLNDLLAAMVGDADEARRA
jgi:hypothetical protein